MGVAVIVKAGQESFGPKQVLREVTWSITKWRYLMITNLSQKKAHGASAPAHPSPIGRFRMPFAILLAALLCGGVDSGYAQDASQKAQSVISSADTSAAVTPLVSEQPQNMDVHDAQNPVANLVSIPLQGNTYFNFGPY